MDTQAIELPGPGGISLENFFSDNLTRLFEIQFSGKVSQAELHSHLIELLKFLYISSKHGGGFIPVTPFMDELWHFMILQTKEYFRICQLLPGKRYIHHKTIPFGEYTSSLSKSEFISESISWIRRYTENFGPFTDQGSKSWGFVMLLNTKMGLSLDKINSLRWPAEKPPTGADHVANAV